MGKKKVEVKEPPPKPPTKFRFYLGSRERYITIRSDFDSGNIGVVRQISEFQVPAAISSTGSPASMTAPSPTIPSIAKAGSTFPFPVSPKTPRANSSSPKSKPSSQSTM